MATPPPVVPHEVPPPLAEYLRRLALWAQQELDRKIPKDEATPQIILSASDQKTPTAIFKVTVNSTGALTATAIPLGGGKP